MIEKTQDKYKNVMLVIKIYMIVSLFLPALSVHIPYFGDMIEFSEGHYYDQKTGEFMYPQWANLENDAEASKEFYLLTNFIVIVVILIWINLFIATIIDILLRKRTNLKWTYLIAGALWLIVAIKFLVAGSFQTLIFSSFIFVPVSLSVYYGFRALSAFTWKRLV